MRVSERRRRGILVALPFLVVASCLTWGANNLAAAAPGPTSAGQQAWLGEGGAARLATGKQSSVPQAAPPKAAPAKQEPPMADSAAPGVAYRQYIAWYGPVTMNPNEWWSAWVFCPSGMLATGGGESNSSAGGVTLHNTTALDDGSGWSVTVTNNSAGVATFKVYTVCFSGLTSYQQLAGKSLIPAGGAGGADSVCPNAQQVLGGGGSSDTLNNNVVTYPSAFHDWWFGMHNEDSVARTANTQAVCGNSVGNYQVVVGSYSNVGVGQVGSGDVSCPSGTYVVSGGGFGGGGGNGDVRLTDSYPFAQGWRVYVQNDGTAQGVARAIVVCGT
jgi:hypothetical protein